MRKSLISGVIVLSLIACGDSGDDGDGDGDSSTTMSETTSTDGGDGDTATSESGDGDSGSSEGDSTSGDGDSTSGDGDSTSGDGDTAGDGDGDGDVEFALTSPDFVMDGVIPSLHHIQGGNVSPALDWVGAPAGTMSFGVFFEDLTINYDHSAIWDIPADATGLPQGVEAAPSPSNVPGAVQCRNWAMQWGYGGPGSDSNTYQFTLYALDVATLPDVTQNTNRSQVKTALEAHAIETVTLSGQTAGPP